MKRYEPSHKSGTPRNGTRGQPAGPIRRRSPLPRMVRKEQQSSASRRLMLIALLGFVVTPLVLVLLVAGGIAIAYSQMTSTLKPRLDEIKNHNQFQSSKIFDRNGTELFELFGAGRREPIKLKDVSEDLINATIAIEDKTFYENSGVDYLGIARAFYQNFTQQEEVSGASTISQQVIKNLVLTDEEQIYEKRYERKLKEIVMAQELNNIYSKDEILELYLNEINYGNLAYGIQAASQIYFGIDAGKLSLAQAALLAGMPQRPSDYNPIKFLQGNKLPGVKLRDGWLDPEYNLPNNISLPKARQIDVLRQMVRLDHASEADALRAAASDLVFTEQKFSLEAPHFVFFVRDYLQQKYGKTLVNEGGLRIITTLDLELQAQAQQVASQRIKELVADERNIHNAAVVVLQPNTGQILAMVGSVSYTQTVTTTTPGEEGNVLDGNVNVTTMQRQPGSALKPFTYLTGMEQSIKPDDERNFDGLTPGSILWDVETRFKLSDSSSSANLNSCLPEGSFWYCPFNFNRQFNGPMRMRMALDNSLNMPAVKALKRSGVGNMLDLLHRAGVAPTSLNRGVDFYGLALTLGGGEVTPLDMATAYNTLASGGRYFPATPILKITDANGKVLEEFKPVPIPEDPARQEIDTSQCVPPNEEEFLEGKGNVAPGTQCLDPRLVHILTDVMSDNEARVPMFGRSNPLILSRPAAVKTGTSEDFRDAWASGFTPFVTVTVWTGNNNNERTGRVESTAGGGVIWNRTMEGIFDNERLMRLLAEPFGGEVPKGFRQSFPGVEERQVCSIPSAFGGPTTELFVEEMENDECDLYETIRVIRIDEKTYCRPVEGQSYPEDQVIEATLWNIPQVDDSERVMDWNWNFGGLQLEEEEGEEGEKRDPVNVRPEDLPECDPSMIVTPTPEVSPTPTLEPGTFLMPDLRHYGENQAKELLISLGISPDLIEVQYQSRSRLNELFDQFAPYAVVSSLPPPGSILRPGDHIILGVRDPNDDGGGQQPTQTPIPPEQPTPPPEQPTPPPEQPTPELNPFLPVPTP